MGEKLGDRQVIESLIRDSRQMGISATKAEKMAREAMIQADRTLREQGKR